MSESIVLVGQGAPADGHLLDVLGESYRLLEPDRAGSADVVVFWPTRHDDPELGVEVARRCRAGILVVVSSARVYGASPRNDLLLDESTAPAEHSADPDVAASVAAEAASLAAAHGRRAVKRVVVLRPVHELGPTATSPLATALRSSRLRTAFGFDPLFPVIHTEDLARAIAAAARSDVSGTFNVCGPGALPLSALARATGTSRVGGLGGLACDLLGRVGITITSHLAPAELRYGLSVDDRRFRDATGYSPLRSLTETVTGP